MGLGPRRWRHLLISARYGQWVDSAKASGRAWREAVRRRSTVGQDRKALSRPIEYDADPFEVELYGLAADPRALLVDRAQRREAGQHVRRNGG